MEIMTYLDHFYNAEWKMTLFLPPFRIKYKIPLKGRFQKFLLSKLVD